MMLELEPEAQIWDMKLIGEGLANWTTPNDRGWLR